tara:strand:+ start:1516 stop:2274 length:759 start_codon:yes stop_codon:yes gene_type:complete
MSFAIAIPSFNRPKTIKKTLHLLEKYNFDKSIITIFLDSEQEKEKYVEEIGTDYTIVIHKHNNIGELREFIRHYYKEGTHLFSLDDDIEQVKEMIDKKTGKEIDNLKQFVLDAFKKCVEAGYYIWGVYPVDNYFFMNKKTTTDLKFICASFHGYIVRHDLDLKIEFSIKEDYVNTIQHYIKDGGVVRFNNITTKTKYYQKTGGCFTRFGDRLKESEAIANQIQIKYPQYVSKRQRKNGMWEIRLKRQKKKSN